MCLAIPGRVIKINKNNEALVDFSGDKRKINYSLINDLDINDWIIAKQNLAINKIDTKEAKKILSIVNKCSHKHK